MGVAHAPPCVLPHGTRHSLASPRSTFPAVPGPDSRHWARCTHTTCALVPCSEWRCQQPAVPRAQAAPRLTESHPVLYRVRRPCRLLVTGTAAAGSFLSPPRRCALVTLLVLLRRRGSDDTIPLFLVSSVVP